MKVILKILILFLCFFFSFVVSSKNLYFTKINFNGLTNFSDDFVLNKIDSKTKISSRLFLKKLLDLEIFDHIKVQSVDDVLNIDVVEKPCIKSIKIYGAKQDYAHLSVLLSMYRLKSGELYDFTTLKFFRSKLEEYYISMGYYNLELDISVDFDSASNAVNINLNIQKHTLLKIKDVTIVGNDIYSEKKLLSLFAESKFGWMSWITKGNIYFQGKFLSDLKRVRSFYLDRGYLDFRINFVKVFLSEDKTHVSIVVSVCEGDEHEFGYISFEGRIMSSEHDAVQSIISFYLKSRNVFSVKRLLKTRNKLKDFFHSRGLMHTYVDFLVLNYGKRAVNVVFVFDVSKRVLVRKVKFIGNSVTSDNALRNFALQMEKSWVSFNDVNYCREELMRYGFARKVGINFRRCHSGKGEIDVIYRLKERKCSRFVAGCSYINGNRFIFHVSANLLNFLGTGKDVSLNVNRGNRNSDYVFNYLDTKFLGNNFDVSYSIYYKTQVFKKGIRFFDYSLDTYGASVSYNSKLNRHKRLNIGFGFDRTCIKLNERKAPKDIKRFIGRQGRKYKEYFLTSSYIYNSLDKIIFPTKGFLNHLNIRVALPGSNLNYYLLNYDATLYFKLYKKLLFGLYSNICYGNKYGDTVYFPFFKNFNLRGMNNVRGYRDRALGPRDSNNDTGGGNFLFCVKMSVYIPIADFLNINNVRTSLFFDMGQAYNTQKRHYKKSSLKKISNKKLFSNKPILRHKRKKEYSSFIRYSVGAALTWHTPFGVPIDVSVAYPLNAASFDRQKRVAFSLGMRH